MVDLPPPDARTSPSTARNREPILQVLRPELPDRGLVLEIAAGAGEHAVFNAAAVPALDWLPTDPAPEAIASITAWRKASGLRNLLEPLMLDAAAPKTWPVVRADVIVNINMVHISPWAATEGLMQGAETVLGAGGLLFLYGPYLEAGVETAPGNLAFDASLKSRNPAWGLRDLQAVTDLASRHGLIRTDRRSLPANNLALVFRRK